MGNAMDQLGDSNPEPFFISFGECVRQIRKAHRLKAWAVAAAADISCPHLSRIEGSLRRVHDLHDVERLLDALEATHVERFHLYAALIFERIRVNDGFPPEIRLVLHNLAQQLNSAIRLHKAMSLQTESARNRSIQRI